MSVFDGLTAVLDATFGAAVTVTPPSGAPWTGFGQFRENPREVLNAAGVVVVVDTPTLRLRRPLDAAIVKGAVVAPAVRPGETWRIKGVYRDRSPAADAYAVLELEVPAVRSDDVVARVRAECPGFQRVDHAMTSIFDEEADAPAALIALVNVEAQRPGLLGMHSQMTEETVGVFIMLRRTQDGEAGEGANDDLDDLRAELRAALINWQPAGADQPLYYAGGRLAERNGQLAWREDFATTIDVRTP